jgi:hypothetical protein
MDELNGLPTGHALLSEKSCAGVELNEKSNGYK